jgi:hypothetical protein
MRPRESISKTITPARAPVINTRRLRAVGRPSSNQAAGEGTLPQSVWAEFAARYWEKAATTLSSVVSEPVVSEPELFLALVRAAGLYRLGVQSIRFSFWIDSQETKDFAGLLPTEEDRTMTAYDQRLREQLQGREFTVLLADVHLYDDVVWSRARRFLRGLYREVGVPCGGVDTGVFFGRYKATPFGVHRGQMSVMTSPAHGVKHFRLWPRGYGDAHEDIRDSLDYARHLQAAFQLCGGQQDILYWPADYWHIGEGAGTFTAALNIGFWWDRPPLSSVLLEMSQQLVEEIGMSTDQGVTLNYSQLQPRNLAQSIPAKTHAALAATRRVLSSSRLEKALALEALRSRSCDGFRDVPPLLQLGPVDWKAGVVVERVPECLILFVPGRAGAVHVAANGHLFRTDNDKRVLQLLASLQSSQSLVLSTLTAKSPAAIELLSWLMNARAIRVL